MYQLVKCVEHIWIFDFCAGIGTLVAMLSSLILKYIDLYNNPSLGENPEFFTSLNSFSVVVDHKNTDKSTPTIKCLSEVNLVCQHNIKEIKKFDFSS